MTLDQWFVIRNVRELSYGGLRVIGRCAGWVTCSLCWWEAQTGHKVTSALASLRPSFIGNNSDQGRSPSYHFPSMRYFLNICLEFVSVFPLTVAWPCQRETVPSSQLKKGYNSEWGSSPLSLYQRGNVEWHFTTLHKFDTVFPPKSEPRRRKVKELKCQVSRKQFFSSPLTSEVKAATEAMFWVRHRQELSKMQRCWKRQLLMQPTR